MKNIPFATLTVGEETYKLKISVSAAIEAEKKLGFSLIRAWTKLDSLNILTTVIWASLQRFHHGATFEQAMSLLDDFIDEGRELEELIDVIKEVYTVSGFMKRVAPEEEKENAPENMKKPQ